MKILLLAAGAAAIAFGASQALSAPMPASPKQPIPYSQLDAYLKASPKQRATKDWWAGAQTGVSTDTSATSSVSPSSVSPSLPGDTGLSVNPTPSQPRADSKAPATSTAVNPPIDNPPSTEVNPPAAAPPGSPPTTIPPK
jgi:hypothetical protein